MPDLVKLTCDPGNNPDRDFLLRQAIQSLRRSLNKLSSRQQVNFTLRHYEGLAVKEISEHLGIETGTVKTYLHWPATQRLKDLADYREDPI